MDRQVGSVSLSADGLTARGQRKAMSDMTKQMPRRRRWNLQ